MRQLARHGIATICTLLIALQASAQGLDPVVERDLRQSSQILLEERAGGGSYRSYRIEIRIEDDRATLAATKDGATRRADVSLEESLGLWDSMLGSGLAEMKDAAPAQPMPDASEFRIGCRIGEADYSFSVYDVDSIEDGHYRDIVRSILAFADRHAGEGGAR